MQFPDRYHVLGPLGRGAGGEVFLAEDRESAARVAIKLLHPHADLADEFQAEVEALGRLSSDRIVGLLDHGTSNGRPYLVCRYIPGIGLDDYMAAHTPPVTGDMPYLATLWLQLLGALDHLHAAGLVHRDIKPANVRLEYVAAGAPPEAAALRGNPFLKATLIDFGFVRNRDRTAAADSSAFAGTLGYCAPEQLRSSALSDERSDLFGFGAILYRCVTGRLPYPDLQALVDGKTPPPPGALNPACPHELDSLVLELLAPSSFKRPASAAETADRVEKILFSAAFAFTPPALPASAHAIDAPPLSRDAAYLLCAAATTPATPPAAAFIERLLLQTGGDPALCARYLARGIAEGHVRRRFGEIELRDAALDEALWLDHDLRELLAGLEARLDPWQRDLARACAFLEEFSPSQAAMASGLSEDAARAALEVLHRSRVLVPCPAGWSFQAALTAAHFRNTCEPGACAAINQRIATHMAATRPPEKLAVDLRRAGRPDDAFTVALAAAEAAQTAGNIAHAMAVLAPALDAYTPAPAQALRAVDILLEGHESRRALALLAALPATEDTRLVMARGRAQIRAGDFAGAYDSFCASEARLGAAAAAQDTSECYRGMGAASRALGRLDEARRAFHRMRKHAERHHLEAARIEALHGLGLVARDGGDLEDAERHLRDALDAARAACDQRRAAIALANLSATLRARADHERAGACLREAIALRTALGDRQGLAIAYSHLANHHMDRGDLAAALDAAAQCYTLFLQSGDQKGQVVSLVNRGSYLGLRGETQEALGALRRASGLARRLRNARLSAEADIETARVLILCGEADAPRLLERVLATPALSAQIEAEACACMAAWHLSQNELAQARRMADRAAERVRLDRNVEASAKLLALRAEIHLAAGETAEALRCAQEAYDGLTATASPFVRGRVARVLGEAWLPRGPAWADRTEKHLREALTILAGIGDAHEHARAQLTWAHLLAYMGEDGDSREAAQTAHAVFLRIGAREEARRAAAFLEEVF